MEITGKIIEILPMRNGTSERGNEWSSQYYVIETIEETPKTMVFNIFGKDKIDKWNLKIGDNATVEFIIDARKWKDKWFNSIKAIDIILNENKPKVNIKEINPDDLPF